MFNIDPDDIPGARRQFHMEGCKDYIRSNKIESFTYSCCDYSLHCEKVKNNIRIVCSGGDLRKRDGTGFKLDFEISDDSVLSDLNNIIINNKLFKDNGYYLEVNGLPSGLGDYIYVIFDSGEKLYKYCNEFCTVDEKSQKILYDFFHKIALDYGYDFTSMESNVTLYDDATVDFLQGTWKGTHFGDSIKVVFLDNRVKIYVNRKLTDDVNYIIVRGVIKPNLMYDEVFEARDENDYIDFSGVSFMKKNNDILLTAYFTEGAYSTCDLLKQNDDE